MLATGSHVEYAVFVGVRDTGGTLGLNFSNPNAQKWTHIMRFCGVPDFNVIWSNSYYEQ